MRLRCLIVDDNASFLEASRTLLERQGITVVGVAATAADCLRRTEDLEPDVVLLDVYLGDESGFEVAKRLPGDRSASKVIFISTHPEQEYADLAAETGALGFLSKSDLSRETIEEVLHRSSAADSHIR